MTGPSTGHANAGAASTKSGTARTSRVGGRATGGRAGRAGGGRRGARAAPREGVSATGIDQALARLAAGLGVRAGGWP